VGTIAASYAHVGARLERPHALIVALQSRPETRLSTLESA
jgi:hypothetical protein